ncbi:hypothetical protein C8Q76DRAFT_669455 [Earliella scabrosa]|nr:hypothetical protein C8Q76DRAFT_669455 [Earliella scabrosa]
MTLEAHEHPFVYADADVIFMSSDSVQFKVHKLVLSLASPFFQDMFRLPQPAHYNTNAAFTVNHPDPDDTSDTLPIVECTETGVALDNLFRLCYPIRDPTFSTIQDVRAALEAALKYDMPEAIYLMRRELVSHIPASPLCVYAIACCLDLEQEARQAARAVFEQGVKDTYVAELEDLTAGAYQRLLDYCQPGPFRLLHFLPRDLSSSHSPQAATFTSDTLNTPTTLAPYPFCEEDADFSIVSSDNVEFRVSTLLIKLSSPALSSMITNAVQMASSSTSTPHSRPTLPVPESSSTLTILLTLCYPLDEPILSSFDDVYAALVAAIKYKVPRAMRFLTSALPALCDDPVKLYFIACSHGLQKLAVTAARRAILEDLSKLTYPKMDSGDLSGGHLYRLLDYQRRIASARLNLLTGRGWIDADMRKVVATGCSGSRPYSGEGYYSCWFKPYLDGVLACTARSGVESVTDISLIERSLEIARQTGMYSSQCSSCTKASGVAALLKFSRYLADKISTVEEQTTLDWKD